jgi:hypothetical protein
MPTNRSSISNNTLLEEIDSSDRMLLKRIQLILKLSGLSFMPADLHISASLDRVREISFIYEDPIRDISNVEYFQDSSHVTVFLRSGLRHKLNIAGERIVKLVKKFDDVRNATLYLYVNNDDRLKTTTDVRILIN